MVRTGVRIGKGWLAAPVLAMALPLAAAGNDLGPGAPARVGGPLNLTPAEHAWLADHPVIRVGADFLAPVSIFDGEDGPLEGVSADYLDVVEAMLGVEFQLTLRTHRNHPRVMQALDYGEIDLVAAAMADKPDVTEGRAVATAPYLAIPVVIVTRADEPRIDDIQALAGRRVSGTPPPIHALRRYGLESEFSMAPPHEGLLGVATGRWDAFVGNLPMVTHHLAEAPVTNIKINGELPLPFRVAMLVRPEDAALAHILDKAFAAIPTERKDAIWRQWFRVNYEETMVSSPWLWGGVGTGTLVLGLVLFQARHTARRMRAVQGTLDQHLMSAHLDARATITEVSKALCHATGYEGAELVGRTLEQIGTPGNSARLAMEAIVETIRTDGSWRGEFTVQRKDGSALWAHGVISPRRRKGETVGFTVVWQDISESKHFRDLSLRDELTGLFNRRHFNAEAPNLLAEAERDNALFALVALDVDCFKAFNDTYGHGAGDEVLAQVGRVLASGLRRESDLAFRLGGEEFAVAFIVAEEADALRIAEALRAAVEFCAIPHAKGPAGVVTASLGLVTAGPDDPRSLERLMAAADEALYEAKNAGRNRVAVAAMSA